MDLRKRMQPNRLKKKDCVMSGFIISTVDLKKPN
jgi:hypothetical protein